jgi:uncharacterized protein (DUF433 family)
VTWGHRRPVQDPYSFPITKDPEVRGGKACIDRTRITVVDIVQLQSEGKTPEEMLNVFAVPLTLAQVHAALTYYYDHGEEIDASFLDEDEVEARIERDRAGHLKPHARR